jgi:hypothetical protein
MSGQTRADIFQKWRTTPLFGLSASQGGHFQHPSLPESGDGPNAGVLWCNSGIKDATLGRHLTVLYSVGFDAHLHHTSWSHAWHIQRQLLR